MGNPFVHVELHTDDVARAKRFYKGLFDWKLEDMQMGDGSTYTMVGVGEGTGGGIMKQPMPGPTAWMTYVMVDDVKKTVARAKKLGGQVINAYTPIPGMGAFGIVTDPSGAVFGVFEAAERQAAPSPPAPPKKKPATASAKKKRSASPRRR